MFLYRGRITNFLFQKQLCSIDHRYCRKQQQLFMCREAVGLSNQLEQLLLLAQDALSRENKPTAGTAPALSSRASAGQRAGMSSWAAELGDEAMESFPRSQRTAPVHHWWMSCEILNSWRTPLWWIYSLRCFGAHFPFPPVVIYFSFISSI